MKTGADRIGIMGGTFDPIHNGHLAMAEAVREAFSLDRVLFIPSGKPPHKRRSEIADKQHRYNMTVLATNSNNAFEVSPVEVEREQLSYTVDTLKILKEEYKDSEIFLVMGADALCDIESWSRVDELLKLCRVVGATRPGIDIDEFKREIEKIQRQFNVQILHVHVPSLDISSTDIRERAKRGSSIKYLIPEEVEKYIYKYKLYR
ncbi:nicotinate-nucleotide adenylyltransferase NadD [Peptoclostridium acidaminophilum DSM 3953]|uniref:Probable nicotinate-nucleotide adenylyltransferase n=1 Tax=Peptoclostridium acidaminophilum DSM 3953 TaxID=1286171 RepID=W8TJR4_PEPAC|nr:nicotinate-nucleotide adenylyltransferase [Peptoclostridium acidaminophilum]AHM56462.1 nicotinate-nucleotide adenylyltransferase NadD [Peptoclostridium acidaminophilum DSM 3953]